MADTLITNKKTLLDLLDSDDLARTRTEVIRATNSRAQQQTTQTPQATAGSDYSSGENPFYGLSSSYKPIETSTAYTSKRSDDILSNANMGGKSRAGSDLARATARATIANTPASVGAGVLSGVEGMVNAPQAMMVSHFTNADRGKSKRELDYANLSDVQQRDAEWHEKYDEQNKKIAEFWDSKRVQILNEGTHNWIKDVQNKNAQIRDAEGSAFTLSDAAFTIGQMAPSIVVGKATGAIAGKLLPDSLLAANYMPLGSGPASAFGPLPATALAAGKASGLAEAAKTLQGITSLSSMFAQVYGNEYVSGREDLGLDMTAAADRALSHAVVETMTETLGGGVPGMNEGLLTKVLTNANSRMLASTAAKFGEEGAKRFVPKALGVLTSVVTSPVFEKVVDVFGEGVEEMISEYYGPWIERVTVDPRTPDATRDEILMAGLNGMFTSVIMQGMGAAFVKTGDSIRKAKIARVVSPAINDIAEASRARMQERNGQRAESGTTVSDAIRDGIVGREYSTKDLRAMADVINEVLSGTITPETKEMFQKGGTFSELIKQDLNVSSIASPEYSKLAFDYFIKPFEVTNDTTIDDLMVYIFDYAVPQLEMMSDVARREAGNRSYIVAREAYFPEAVRDSWVQDKAVSAWAEENEVAFGTKEEKKTARKLFAKTLTEQIAALHTQGLQGDAFYSAKKQLLGDKVKYEKAYTDIAASGKAEAVYGKGILQNRAFYEDSKAFNGALNTWVRTESGEYLNFDRFVESKLADLGMTRADLDTDKGKLQLQNLKNEFNGMVEADVKEVNSAVTALQERAAKSGLTIELSGKMASADKSAYDKKTKTITINQNKVRHADVLRYVLSHEMVHHITNIDEAHRDSFINYVKGMMTSVGLDYDARYSAIGQIKDKKTGAPKYTPEQIDEEVCTRFMSSLLSDVDLLMDMAEADAAKLSDLIGYLDEISNQNPEIDFQTKIAVNQIKADANKALAGVKPEPSSGEAVDTSLDDEIEIAESEDTAAEEQTAAIDTEETDNKKTELSDRAKEIKELIDAQEELLAKIGKTLQKSEGENRSFYLAKLAEESEKLAVLKNKFLEEKYNGEVPAPMAERVVNFIDPITGEVDFDKLGAKAEPDKRAALSDVFKNKKKPLPDILKRLNFQPLSKSESDTARPILEERAEKRAAAAAEEAKRLNTTETTLSDLPHIVFKKVDVVLPDRTRKSWIVAYPDETHKKGSKQGYKYSKTETDKLSNNGGKGLGFRKMSKKETGLDNTYWVKEYDANFYYDLVGADSVGAKLDMALSSRPPETTLRPYKVPAHGTAVFFFRGENNAPMMGMSILEDTMKYGMRRSAISAIYRGLGFKYDRSLGMLTREFDTELWRDVLGLPMLQTKYLDFFNAEHSRRWELFEDGASIELSGELKGWNVSVVPEIGFVVTNGEETVVKGFSSDDLDELMGYMLYDMGGITSLRNARTELLYTSRDNAAEEDVRKQYEAERTANFISNIIDHSYENVLDQLAQSEDKVHDEALADGLIEREVKSLLGREWSPTKGAKSGRAELETLQKTYTSVMNTPRGQSSVSDIELNQLKNDIEKLSRSLAASEVARGKRLIGVKWKGMDNYILFPRGIIRQLIDFYINGDFVDPTILPSEYTNYETGEVKRIGFGEVPIEIMDVDSEEIVWDANSYSPESADKSSIIANENYIKNSPEYLHDSNSWRERRRKSMKGFGRNAAKQSIVSIKGLSGIGKLADNPAAITALKEKQSGKTVERKAAKDLGADFRDETDFDSDVQERFEKGLASTGSETSLTKKGLAEDVEDMSTGGVYNPAPYEFDHGAIGNLDADSAEALVNSSGNETLRRVTERAIENLKRNADYAAAQKGEGVVSESIANLPDKQAAIAAAKLYNTTNAEEIKNYINIAKFYKELRELEASKSKYTTKSDNDAYKAEHNRITSNIESLVKQNKEIRERNNAANHPAEYAASQRKVAQTAAEDRVKLEARLAEIDSEEKRVSALESRTSELLKLNGRIEAVRSEIAAIDSANKNVSWDDHREEVERESKEAKEEKAKVSKRRKELSQKLGELNLQKRELSAKVGEVQELSKWTNVRKNIQSEIEKLKEVEATANARAEMAEKELPKKVKEKTISELLIDADKLKRAIALEEIRKKNNDTAANTLRKSRRYTEAKEAYNTEEIKKVESEIADFRKESQKAANAKKKLVKALAAVESELDAKEKPKTITDEDNLRNAISDKLDSEKEIGRLQAQIEMWRSQINKAEDADVKALRDRLAEVEAEIAAQETAKPRSRSDELKRHIKLLEEELAEARGEEGERLNKRIAELEEQIRKLQRKRGLPTTTSKESAAIKEEVETLKEKLSSARNEFYELAAEARERVNPAIANLRKALSYEEEKAAQSSDTRRKTANKNKLNELERERGSLKTQLSNYDSMEASDYTVFIQNAEALLEKELGRLAEAEKTIDALSKGRKGKNLKSKLTDEVLSEVFAGKRSVSTGQTQTEVQAARVYPVGQRGAYVDESGNVTNRGMKGGVLYDASMSAPDEGLFAASFEEFFNEIMEALDEENAIARERRASQSMYEDMFDILDMQNINPDEGISMLADDVGRPITGEAAAFYDGRAGSLNADGEVITYYFDDEHTPYSGVHTPYGKGFVLSTTHSTEYSPSLTEVYANSTRPVTDTTTVTDAEFGYVKDAFMFAAEQFGIPSNSVDAAFDAAVSGTAKTGETNLLLLLALTADNLSANGQQVSTLQSWKGEALMRLGYDGVATDNGIILFDISQIKNIHDNDPGSSDTIGFSVSEEALHDTSWANVDYDPEARLDPTVDKDYLQAQLSYGTWENGTPYSSTGRGYNTKASDSFLENNKLVPRGTVFEQRYKEGITNELMTHLRTTNPQIFAAARKSIFSPSRTNQNGQLTGSGLNDAIASFLAEAESNGISSTTELAKGIVLAAEIVDYSRHGEVDDSVTYAWERIMAECANAVHEAGSMLQFVRAIKQVTPQGRVYNIQAMCRAISRDLAKRKGLLHHNLNAALDNWLSSAEFQELMKRYGEIDTNDIDALDRFEDEEVIPAIAEKIPSTLEDRANAWRYLCMLGNPRTHIRNFASNMAMKYASRISYAIAAELEDRWAEKQEAKGIDVDRVRTNKRAPTKEQHDFVVNDSMVMKESMMHGGKQGFMTKVNQAKKAFNDKGLGKIINTLNELNSAGLEGADWIFMQESYIYNMERFLAANNWSVSDLSGSTALSTERLNRARDFAIKKAWEDTYRSLNKFADLLNSAEKNIPYASLIIEGLIPFKRTPANILKTGLKYSPAGFIRAGVLAYKAARNPALIESSADSTYLVPSVTMDQVFDQIGASTTGSIATALGMLLAGMCGMKAGGSDDDREEYYDEMLGRQKYSLTIPWIARNFTLDWMSPAAMPVMAGVELYNAIHDAYTANGATVTPMAIVNGFAACLGQMADPVTELSMLQPLFNSINAMTSSNTAKVGDFFANSISNYFLQFIPTATSQVARAMFPTRGSTYVPSGTDAIGGKVGQVFLKKAANKSLIAHLAHAAFNGGDGRTTEDYVDFWGRTDGGTDTGNAFLNLVVNLPAQIAPWYSKKINVTEVDDLVSKVYSVTGDKGVLPKSPPSSYQSMGRNYRLTSKEYETSKKTAGALKYAGIQSAREYDVFMELDDYTQADILKDIESYADAMAKKEFYENRGFQRWLKESEMEEALKKNPDVVGYRDTSGVDKVDAFTSAGYSVGQYYTIKVLIKDMTSREKKVALAELGVPRNLRDLFL